MRVPQGAVNRPGTTHAAHGPCAWAQVRPAQRTAIMLKLTHTHQISTLSQESKPRPPGISEPPCALHTTGGRAPRHRPCMAQLEACVLVGWHALDLSMACTARQHARRSHLWSAPKEGCLLPCHRRAVDGPRCMLHGVRSQGPGGLLPETPTWIKLEARLFAKHLRSIRTSNNMAGLPSPPPPPHPPCAGSGAMCTCLADGTNRGHPKAGGTARM